MIVVIVCYVPGGVSGFLGRLGDPGNMHGCGVGFLDFVANFYPWMGELGGSRNHGQHLKILK